MSRKPARKVSCGVELALAVLGGKWKPVILAHLKEGALRYGELRQRIPALSDKMLTQRLRELAELGLVRRRKSGGRGASSSYEITTRARSLRPALESLNDWGDRTANELGVTIERRW